jgi:folylpolyglutamate synthase
MARTSAQLELYQRDEVPGTFFDHVIFCTNVTYADGGFKGGEYLFRSTLY